MVGNRAPPAKARTCKTVGSTDELPLPLPEGRSSGGAL